MADIKAGLEGGECGKRGKRGKTGPAGPAGPLGFPPVIAAARVNGADGTLLAQTGFSSSVRVSPGRYQLTLSNPPADIANAVTLLTIVGTVGGEASYVYLFGGVIDVHTFTAGGSVGDQVFQIVTFDLTA